MLVLSKKRRRDTEIGKLIRRKRDKWLHYQHSKSIRVSKKQYCRSLLLSKGQGIESSNRPTSSRFQANSEIFLSHSYNLCDEFQLRQQPASVYYHLVLLLQLISHLLSSSFNSILEITKKSATKAVSLTHNTGVYNRLCQLRRNEQPLCPITGLESSSGSSSSELDTESCTARSVTYDNLAHHASQLRRDPPKKSLARAEAVISALELHLTRSHSGLVFPRELGASVGRSELTRMDLREPFPSSSPVARNSSPQRAGNHFDWSPTTSYKIGGANTKSMKRKNSDNSRSESKFDYANQSVPATKLKSTTRNDGDQQESDCNLVISSKNDTSRKPERNSSCERVQKYGKAEVPLRHDAFAKGEAPLAPKPDSCRLAHSNEQDLRMHEEEQSLKRRKRQLSELMQLERLEKIKQQQQRWSQDYGRETDCEEALRRSLQFELERKPLRGPERGHPRGLALKPLAGLEFSSGSGACLELGSAIALNSKPELDSSPSGGSGECGQRLFGSLRGQSEESASSGPHKGAAGGSRHLSDPFELGWNKNNNRENDGQIASHSVSELLAYFAAPKEANAISNRLLKAKKIHDGKQDEKQCYQSDSSSSRGICRRESKQQQQDDSSGKQLGERQLAGEQNSSSIDRHLVLISESAISNLSDQIALSLNKMKDLEDQVRILPELQRRLEHMSLSSRASSSSQLALTDYIENGHSRGVRGESNLYSQDQHYHHLQPEGNCDSDTLDYLPSNEQLCGCLGPNQQQRQQQQRQHLSLQRGSSLRCPSNSSSFSAANRVGSFSSVREPLSGRLRGIKMEAKRTGSVAAACEARKLNYEDLLDDLVSLSYSVNYTASKPSAQQPQQQLKSDEFAADRQQEATNQRQRLLSSCEPLNTAKGHSTRHNNINNNTVGSELVDEEQSQLIEDDSSAVGFASQSDLQRRKPQHASASLQMREQVHHQINLMRSKRAPISRQDEYQLQQGGNAARVEPQPNIAAQPRTLGADFEPAFLSSTQAHSRFARQAKQVSSGKQQQRDNSAHFTNRLVHRCSPTYPNNRPISSDSSQSLFNNNNSQRGSNFKHKSQAAASGRQSSSPSSTPTTPTNSAARYSSNTSINSTRFNRHQQNSTVLNVNKTLTRSRDQQLEQLFNTSSQNNISQLLSSVNFNPSKQNNTSMIIDHQTSTANNQQQIHRQVTSATGRQISGSVQNRYQQAGCRQQHQQQSTSLQASPVKSHFDCGCQSIREHLRYNTISRESRLQGAKLTQQQQQQISSSSQQNSRTSTRMVDASTNTELSMSELITRGELQHLIETNKNYLSSIISSTSSSSSNVQLLNKTSNQPVGGKQIKHKVQIPHISSSISSDQHKSDSSTGDSSSNSDYDRQPAKRRLANREIQRQKQQETRLISKRCQLVINQSNPSSTDDQGGKSLPASKLANSDETTDQQSDDEEEEGPFSMNGPTEPFSLGSSYQDPSDFEEYFAYEESLDNINKGYKSQASLMINDTFRLALIKLNERLTLPEDEQVLQPIDPASEFIQIIRKEWFEVSAKKEAPMIKTKRYCDYFQSFTSSDLASFVVNLSDNAGNTALHYAASNLRLDIIKVLLDTKVCDVNKRNKAGYTSTMLLALVELVNQADREVARELFSLGDINIKSRSTGQTALMLAASHGRLETCKLLLSCGADPSLNDFDGSTALMCGSENGSVEVVKCILAHPKTDSIVTDNDGLDALQIAISNGHQEIAVLLCAAQQVAQPQRNGIIATNGIEHQENQRQRAVTSTTNGRRPASSITSIASTNGPNRNGFHSSLRTTQRDASDIVKVNGKRPDGAASLRHSHRQH